MLTKVAELMDPISGSWDEALVQDIFSEFDVDAILKLRVNLDMEDRPAWHFDKKGLFSVKSAYKVAVQRREDEKGGCAENSESLSVEKSVFRWDKIRGMEIPNKVKMFAWRMAHKMPDVPSCWTNHRQQWQIYHLLKGYCYILAYSQELQRLIIATL